MNGSAASDAPTAAPEDDRATDPQRVALLRWHVDPERARDPGLTRAEASAWLGRLIAEKRSARAGERGSGPTPPARPSAPTPVPTEPPLGRNPPTPIPPTPTVPGAPPEPTTTEPARLELEIAAPTGIPYSTVRFRTAASRIPGEPLAHLADRLTDELLAVVLREVGRVGAALRSREPTPSASSRG